MIVFLILFLSCVLTAYMYFTRHFNHWKDRGIFYLKPTAFIGNLGPILTSKDSIGDFLRKIYDEHENEPYVGIFVADKPCLVVRDFDLVNRIFKQDFNYFGERNLVISKKTDPLGSKSLFSIHGKEWKNTRAKLSPIFTTKKQKAVFEAMVRVADKFEKRITKETTIDIKLLSGCFISDILSHAVFRKNGRAIEEPNTDGMRKLGNRLFEESLNQGLRSNMLFLAPELMDTLNISLFPQSIYSYIKEEVRSAVAKGSSGSEGDYIDSLIDLRKKGSWEGNDGEIIEPNDEVLVGHMFMFYTAGFETATSGVTFILLEAAKNPDIQTKLKDEIKDMYAKHEGELTLEGLNEMSYVASFITECLRKYPPFPFVDRKCTMDYTIPGTDIVIQKGTIVMVPMLGLQNDKKFYEDPDAIIPERFENGKIDTNKPYFPFGTGPRQCLGMRFALLMLKLSVVACLRNHSITVNKATPTYLKMSPKRFGTAPVADVFLDIQRDE